MNLLPEVRNELLQAAARRRRTRSRWSPRALGVAAATLLVAGTATAAVISGSSEPSPPLAGSLAAGPSARGYAVSVAPDLRAGQVGWCSTTRLTRGGRPAGAGTGCGPAATDASPFVSGASIYFKGSVLSQAVVTSRVAVVVFPGNRRVATRADSRLPPQWRGAISLDTTGRTTQGQPAYEDASGRPIVFDQAGFASSAKSRAMTSSAPGVCTIAQAPGYKATQARAADPIRQPKQLAEPSFFSCAHTVFSGPRTHGRTASRLTATILLNANDPKRRAANLPPSPDITAARTDAGWLVITGPTKAQRAKLLHALQARSSSQ